MISFLVSLLPAWSARVPESSGHPDKPAPGEFLEWRCGAVRVEDYLLFLWRPSSQAVGLTKGLIMPAQEGLKGFFHQLLGMKDHVSRWGAAILVGFEKTLSSYVALLHLAAAIICWRKVGVIYG
jgi:hypothetical protein